MGGRGWAPGAAGSQGSGRLPSGPLTTHCHLQTKPGPRLPLPLRTGRWARRGRIPPRPRRGGRPQRGTDTGEVTPALGQGARLGARAADLAPWPRPGECLCAKCRWHPGPHGAGPRLSRAAMHCGRGARGARVAGSCPRGCAGCMRGGLGCPRTRSPPPPKAIGGTSVESRAKPPGTIQGSGTVSTAEHTAPFPQELPLVF